MRDPHCCSPGWPGWVVEVAAGDKEHCTVNRLGRPEGEGGQGLEVVDQVLSLGVHIKGARPLQPEAGPAVALADGVVPES